MESIEEFEAARPRLLSLAHRMLGSVHDAEDAVQTAWLRTRTAGERIDNPVGWFTTVTTRVCLDQLRARHRRGEVPLLADAIPAAQIAADEDFIRSEDVSRALLVLLEQLPPRQRVSYVLHDLFAVPFAQVAAILDTTPANAKKLASRGRARTHQVADQLDAGGDESQHREVVTAFLDAARGGDLRRMITLMAPGCVRTVDVELLPPGVAPTVVGAVAVAEETRLFADRIHASTTLRLNGRTVDVIAPGGHPLAAVVVATAGPRVAAITITRIRGTDLLTAA
ncbi:RNA polymerase sigma-70 factor, ECF subfamily [Amycolatopsis marina]|uniref:RNA polymerase sigma-70 factor, ECF subfamily n=1 Tax=Amycolatopsis marina TaxID=490629 RepID=A0A1I1BLN6_9PSEU|nr:sigma-70 family RNA polymerase sigma factor [Amycolatopsis marina]SFB51314.1 RNA polymerase sigma-70 factor, ECF subfamily [Amycolatopsis marina]